MEDNPGTPPGNGWKQILSAKRGAKGEKGERGEQGEKGIPGRNGLDATLPEGFTDQLLEIANKVFEDDRSGAYAVTSFRGWFMPNEAYRSGDLVNYDGSLYLCTSGGAYRSIAESNGAFELVVGVPKVAAQTFMLWQGEWGASRTYNTGNTVRDAGGTYVSTTYNNTERPSPQAIGSPVWVSGEGDTPAWSAEASAAASAITYGQRYTYTNDGFANRLRMWVDEADPNITYEVFSRPEPNGDNPTLNQLFPETSFGQTGWFTINISHLLIAAGAEFDLLVIKRNRASSTTADYEYVYSAPQNAAVPAAGQIQHGRSATDELRINVVDNQGQDRSAAFAVLVPGDKISGAGIIWTIIDIVDNGTWYLFEVTPAVVGTEGTGNFTFETFTALPINYVRIVDHYASNIEGLYSDTAGNTVISSNMYGIDLEYQQASISSNWDVVTPASNYTDGAGGFSFTAEQTGWVKARAARVELSGVETADNQWTELARMPVDKGEAYTFEYAITCKRLDDFGFGNSRYGALVQHNGGLEVSSEAMYENLPAGLDTRASTDGNDLVFEVNGRTGQNWFWTLDMDVVEL